MSLQILQMFSSQGETTENHSPEDKPKRITS
jgi:hypothetical protein